MMFRAFILQGSEDAKLIKQSGPLLVRTPVRTSLFSEQRTDSNVRQMFAGLPHSELGSVF